MADEACPRDLPEQGVQPRITVVADHAGKISEPRVDEQHPTDPDNQ